MLLDLPERIFPFTTKGKFPVYNKKPKIEKVPLFPTNFFLANAFSFVIEQIKLKLKNEEALDKKTADVTADLSS